MSVSRVIEVSFGGGSIAYAKVDTAYFYNNGIIFKPTDIDLPASYQVHWADSPQASSTLETIGTAEGAPIPDDLWNRSRVIYGWIYLHPTNDSGVTGYEVRIYKNVRAGLPDGTEPTPAEQSTIDQLIGALNSAVEQAEDAEERIENMSVSATTLAEGASATVTKSEQDGVVHLAFGIPKGATGDDGYSPTANVSKSGKTATITITDKNGTTTAQVEDGEDGTDGIDGISPSVSVTDITGGHRVVITDKDGAKSFDVEDGATGATPNLTIGTVETLEPTESATATITGTPENPVLNLGIPQGDAGEVTLDEFYKAFPTDTASGAIASFSDGADDLPLKSLVVNINPIQDLSHGDPSPENLCPISGWTEVDVEQRGVNVWDEEWEVGEYGNDGTKANTGAGIRSKNYINVLPNLTYAFISTLNLYVCEYDIDKNFIKRYYVVPLAPNKQVSSNCYYVTFNTASAYGTTYNHDISINYPSTDHSYHPFTGRSITIQLGQTVYGAKLYPLEGKAVIDRAMRVFDGTEVWSNYATKNGFSIGINDMLVGYRQNGISNYLVRNPSSGQCGFWLGVNNRTLYVLDVVNNIIAEQSTTEWRAYLAEHPLQILYPLAEPIEIQLDSHTLNSLYGQNNLWADSGDTEVEYRADTKLFIERLTAPDSADMVADANITSGQYFMVGNSLYKATANIANGGQIVVGTNATRVSLAQALNEINA